MKCKDNGHDSRTFNGCPSIRLFGVQIDVADDFGKKDGKSFIRKSKSLGNLEACNTDNTPVESGYLSDGFIHQSSRVKEGRERKIGKPWSEEEHRSFLLGLENLGKGDWKGIAKKYVPSRNSSQIASHAQKYFIRLSAPEKKKRSSVFDIPLNEKNASATLGSPSKKAFENSQHASSSGAALKNLGEFKGQVSMQPPSTSSEKPPLSPMPKLHGITNFNPVAPYMAGGSCINQSFLEHKTTPTVSWLPFVNYPNQNHVFLPIFNPTIATCAHFKPRPSDSMLRGPSHQGESSQAGPSTESYISDLLGDAVDSNDLELFTFMVNKDNMSYTLTHLKILRTLKFYLVPEYILVFHDVALNNLAVQSHKCDPNLLLHDSVT